MRLSRILYIIIIVIAFYMGIAYLEIFPTVLVAILIMLPIVLVIFAFIQSRGIRVSFNKMTQTMSAGDKCTLKFKIKNSYIFPVIAGTVKVRFSYAQNKSVAYEELPFSIGAMTSLIASLDIRPQYSGVLYIEIESVKVLDLLGLFSIKCKAGRKKYSITVMPNLVSIAVNDRASHFNAPFADENGGDVRGNDKKGNPFYKDRPGDDPSEVFRTREYVPGDKLSHADWKTSAKTGTLMIKDYSFPIVDKTCVVIDMNYDYQSDFHNKILCAMSLCVSILNTDNYLSMLWFDAKNNSFHQHHVEKDDDLFESTGMLIGSECAPELDFLTYDENIAMSGTIKQIFYISSNVSEEQISKMSGISDGIIRYVINICDIKKDSCAYSEKLYILNVYEGEVASELKNLQVVIY